MKIYFDLPFVFTLLVLITGIITLIDILFLAKKREFTNKKHWLIDNARSFFPMLLLIWLVRSFIFDHNRVPSPSLAPTILPGDFILVNKFAYGIRLPVLNTKIWHLGAPKRGDIALFRYPNDPSIIYVKRVIGLPGDHVVYRNKTLIINEKEMSQEFIGLDLDKDKERGLNIPVKVFMENLDGIKHKIFVKSDREDGMDIDVIVPNGNYFMMGDNRDSSSDSRYWGFMPEQNLVGKALGIWMNFDTNDFTIQWKRIGTKI